MLDRLSEFENESLHDGQAREWFGHVTPSIERLCSAIRAASRDGAQAAPAPTVPAREGGEAQRGLNDVFPGDPYPVKDILCGIRQRAVQAIGAGLSRRDWHATETAYNELRDRLDDLLRRMEVRS